MVSKEEKKFIIENNDLRNEIKNLKKSISHLKKENDVKESFLSRFRDIGDELYSIKVALWLIFWASVVASFCFFAFNNIETSTTVVYSYEDNQEKADLDNYLFASNLFKEDYALWREYLKSFCIVRGEGKHFSSSTDLMSLNNVGCEYVHPFDWETYDSSELVNFIYLELQTNNTRAVVTQQEVN